MTRVWNDRRSPPLAAASSGPNGARTWPGGWDTPNHLLRGHFSGHWMTMLAQCWAATGEEIFLTKLDYIVTELFFSR